MYAVPFGIDPNKRLIPYAELLSRPHQVRTMAQLEAPDGTVIASSISVSGGEVTVDASAQFRRSCRLQLSAFSGGAGRVTDESGLTADQIQQLRDSLIPGKAGDPASPYGNAVRVWRGLSVPGHSNATLQNDWYLWELGVFRLARADVEDDGTPQLSVTGYDRSRTVSRNKLTAPWVVSSGTNWGDAIVALVKDRDPRAPARAHSVTATAPATVVVDPESDPWTVATEWAAAAGQEVFFDNAGYLVIRPEPDTASSPIAWEYSDAAGGNAVLLGVGRSMTDEPGYNGVVLTAESTTLPAPLRAEAWDLNPSSPTYSQGAYGRVPKFVSNPYVGTQAQADAAAQAELLRSAGGTERVSIACVPNPAHEAGDVIRVSRPLSRIDHVGIIESMTIPLAPGDPMSITCRERRSMSA